jgi:predicted nucleic acid-binding Zn finger protein
LRAGVCACPFFVRLSLQRGPCKHLLALHRAALRASG